MTKFGNIFFKLLYAEAGKEHLTPSESVPEKKTYERKFSFLQRLFKVLFSPSEGMEDVALAPSYWEIFAVLIIQIVIALAGVAMVFTKIQFVGALPSVFWGILMFAMVIGVIFAFVLLIARWLIKSIIVKAACDSGSGWDLKTAASVTGYAYLADIVFSVIGLIILWFLIPSITFDITRPEAVRQIISDLEEQIGWIRFLFGLPVSLLGLVWKSYLGALGTHFGTRKKCSIGLGFAVFFCLGFVTLLISYIFSMRYSL